MAETSVVRKDQSKSDEGSKTKWLKIKQFLFQNVIYLGVRFILWLIEKFMSDD